MLKSKSETGDTIVEVLIALAVLALILTGAFVSAQSSLAGSRRSQERVEGLKTAEVDVEKLRLLASTDSSSILFDTSKGPTFCLDKTGAPHVISLPALATDNFTGYYQGGGGPTANDSCARTPSGGVTYYPAVTRVSPNTFTVSVRWDRAGGGDKQEATLTYRVYPGQ